MPGRDRRLATPSAASGHGGLTGDKAFEPKVELRLSLSGEQAGKRHFRQMQTSLGQTTGRRAGEHFLRADEHFRGASCGGG